MGLMLLKTFVSCFLILLSMLLLQKTALASTKKQGGGNDTDHLALLSIKAHVSTDLLGITSSWNDTLHFCNWKGVSCGRRQRVTGLDLDSFNLAGSISPSIGNLTFLRNLNLSGNSFQGEIPLEFGLLFRLQVLDLSKNLLGGQIPVNLSQCHNLKLLFLNGNQFIGNPPKELGSLSHLVQLSIASNNLTGTIPPSFGNLSSLQLFSAHDNMLEGSIPDSLGSLKNLTYLSLFLNNLSGVVPPSIYNLSSLTSFLAYQNLLEGSLPQNLGLTWPSIRRFTIWQNQFSGSIPLSISNATELEQLNLSMNKFSPGVGVDFGNLKNLWRLALVEMGLGTGGANDLSFISTLANCSKLRSFSVYGNGFGGVLPKSIANLSTQLESLSMAANYITGTIPEGIANLASLSALDMHSNQLTGCIPDSIDRLVKIQEMGFGENNLSGEIPSSIGNLTLLNQLWLENNDFQGNIPSSLGNCQRLLLLHLYGNNLSGSIPREVIGLSSLSKSLDLSWNGLSGPLPPEVGKLGNLVELNLSHNKLSGEIPSSLGSCSSLRYLYLDDNSLGGAIPQSFGSLKGIEELDLSDNHLSGEIPKILGTFPFLWNLNLSSNDLEGAIPVGLVFQNASAISVAGNNKLCGGIPELQLPACASDKPRKKKISLRPAFIAAIVCGVFGVIFASSILVVWWLRKTRNQPSLASSSMDSPRNISYQNLLKATNGFSSANLIGTGSFGLVYKGILHPSDHKPIAVKVLNQQNKGASRSFMSECKALKNIRHRNLIKIVSACASVDSQGNDFKALVYEYMENGNLGSWLHPAFSEPSVAHEQPQSLNLVQRLGIAIDVASALDYLHNCCHIPVIHCDIKPSNILLDGDMTAHVGDFGLAKLLEQRGDNEISQSQTCSVGVRGTIGYAAPEYGMGSVVSTSGDVYSYGILLLELFTGKSPTDGLFKDGMNIHKFAKMALPGRAMEIVDQELLAEEEGERITSMTQMERGKIRECLILILGIGVACSEESPRERITIADAARRLHVIKEMLVERRTRIQM